MWTPSLNKSPSAPGNWACLSPWWQDTLNLWLSQGWSPARDSLSLATLREMPDWNNRLLSSNASKQVTLHRTENGRRNSAANAREQWRSRPSPTSFDQTTVSWNGTNSKTL